MAGREPLNRGDIRWYRFASPNKRRPVLILGQETVLRSSSDIPVIPLSTQVRGLPWEVLLGPEEGFKSLPYLNRNGFVAFLTMRLVHGFAAFPRSDGRKSVQQCWRFLD